MLKLFGDYLHHFEGAVKNLDTYLGPTYRGISIRVKSATYKIGDTITWQGPSSASQLATVPINFVTCDGAKLSGTFFVIESLSGKMLHTFSEFPEEMEVIFSTNSFFKVMDFYKEPDRKLQALPDLA